MLPDVLYLYLVEQNHAVRLPSHRLCKLPSALEADVAGWCSNQSRSAVLLRVLAHVQPYDHLLAVKQLSSQRLRGLGLSTTCASEEHEAACRSVLFAESCSAPQHRFAYGVDCLVLPHHSLVDGLVQVEQAGAVGL